MKSNKHIIRLIGSKDESDLHTLKKKLASYTASCPKSSPMSKAMPILDPSPRLLLILEFAPNGHMWEYSHANPQKIGHKLWCKWAKQLGGALAYIHSVGIVHHDIKPHNILLSEFLDIRVADFGNACFASTTPTSSSPQLRDGLGRGTQAYSAPELLTPPTPYSFPVDIYSAGVTLCSVISGLEPFSKCKSSVHILMSVRKGFFESGMQGPRVGYYPNGSKVDEKVWEIIDKMVDRRSEVRPNGMEVIVMVEDIEDCI